MKKAEESHGSHHSRLNTQKDPRRSNITPRRSPTRTKEISKKQTNGPSDNSNWKWKRGHESDLGNQPDCHSVRSSEPPTTLLSPTHSTTNSSFSLDMVPLPPLSNWFESEISRLRSVVSDKDMRLTEQQRERDEALVLADDVAQQLQVQTQLLQAKEGELEKMKTVYKETKAMVLQAAAACEKLSGERKFLQDKLALLDNEKAELQKKCEKLEKTSNVPNNIPNRGRLTPKRQPTRNSASSKASSTSSCTSSTGSTTGNAQQEKERAVEQLKQQLQTREQEITELHIRLAKQQEEIEQRQREAAIALQDESGDQCSTMTGPTLTPSKRTQQQRAASPAPSDASSKISQRDIPALSNGLFTSPIKAAQDECGSSLAFGSYTTHEYSTDTTTAASTNAVVHEEVVMYNTNTVAGTTTLQSDGIDGSEGELTATVIQYIDSSTNQQAIIDQLKQQVTNLYVELDSLRNSETEKCIYQQQVRQLEAEKERLLVELANTHQQQISRENRRSLEGAGHKSPTNYPSQRETAHSTSKRSASPSAPHAVSRKGSTTTNKGRSASPSGSPSSSSYRGNNPPSPPQTTSTRSRSGSHGVNRSGRPLNASTNHFSRRRTNSASTGSSSVSAPGRRTPQQQQQQDQTKTHDTTTNKNEPNVSVDSILNCSSISAISTSSAPPTIDAKYNQLLQQCVRDQTDKWNDNTESYGAVVHKMFHMYGDIVDSLTPVISYVNNSDVSSVVGTQQYTIPAMEPLTKQQFMGSIRGVNASDIAATVTAVIRSLQHQMEWYVTQISLLNSKNENTRQQFTQAQQQVANLTQQQNNADHTHQVVHSIQAEATAAVSAAQCEAAAAKQRADEILRDASSKVEEAASAAEKAMKAAEQGENRRVELEDEVEKLRDQLDIERKALVEQKEKYQNCISEMEVLQEAINSNQSIVETHKANEKRFKEECQQLKNEIDILVNNLNDLNKQGEGIRQELAEVKQREAELSDREIEWCQKEQEWNEAHGSWLIANTNWTDTKDELDNTIKNLEGEVQEGTNVICNYKRICDENNGKISKLSQKCEDMELTIQQMKAAQAATQRLYEVADKEVAHYRSLAFTHYKTEQREQASTSPTPSSEHHSRHSMPTAANNSPHPYGNEQLEGSKPMGNGTITKERLVPNSSTSSNMSSVSASTDSSCTTASTCSTNTSTSSSSGSSSSSDYSSSSDGTTDAHETPLPISNTHSPSGNPQQRHQHSPPINGLNHGPHNVVAQDHTSDTESTVGTERSYISVHTARSAVTSSLLDEEFSTCSSQIEWFQTHGREHHQLQQPQQGHVAMKYGTHKGGHQQSSHHSHVHTSTSRPLPTHRDHPSQLHGHKRPLTGRHPQQHSTSVAAATQGGQGSNHQRHNTNTNTVEEREGNDATQSSSSRVQERDITTTKKPTLQSIKAKLSQALAGTATTTIRTTPSPSRSTHSSILQAMDGEEQQLNETRHKLDVVLSKLDMGVSSSDPIPRAEEPPSPTPPLT